MRCCVTGRLEINQVDTGSEMGHIWTGCQSIAEPDKSQTVSQIHMQIYS